MRAIILAGGMGTRLGKYTEELPKGMLSFLGKSLIERQLETLRAAGVMDITIIRGYNPHKISFSGVRYRENAAYATTNMVATLMEAKDLLLDTAEDILVCYSDIVYERRLLDTIRQSSAAVSVLADEAYLPYWKARLDDWESDVESLQYDGERNITEIGTPRCPLEHARSRYIGMIKFTPAAARELVRAFEENKDAHWDTDKPWRKSKSFRKAYMTCMLQELVDRGVEVKVVPVRHGWMEFDTVEDYEKALGWSQDGTLGQFIHLKPAMKRIGITQRVVSADVGAARDALEQDYVQYYSGFGIALIPIPNTVPDVATHLDALQLDGIILSGGNDINPRIYGGEPVPGVVYADDRDRTELAVLEYAVAHRLPVLCECRGTQFLNAHFGGTLRAVDKHVRVQHRVAFTPHVGAELPASTTTNSYHNFGFTAKELAPKLKAFAVADDGVIEGVFHLTLPIAGILWHPERESPDPALNTSLVKAFLSREWFWR